jgi:hypothetical protein
MIEVSEVNKAFGDMGNHYTAVGGRVHGQAMVPGVGIEPTWSVSPEGF